MGEVVLPPQFIQVSVVLSAHKEFSNSINLDEILLHWGVIPQRGNLRVKGLCQEDSVKAGNEEIGSTQSGTA